MFRVKFLAKKHIFDERWVKNFFPAKVWVGEELKQQIVLVRVSSSLYKC